MSRAELSNLASLLAPKILNRNLNHKETTVQQQAINHAPLLLKLANASNTADGKAYDAMIFQRSPDLKPRSPSGRQWHSPKDQFEMIYKRECVE